MTPDYQNSKEPPSSHHFKDDIFCLQTVYLLLWLVTSKIQVIGLSLLSFGIKRKAAFLACFFSVYGNDLSSASASISLGWRGKEKLQSKK